VIKFTTLFGLLAVEIAVQMTLQYQERLKLDPGTTNWSPWIGGFFFLIALCFVYRSFYGMRIPEESANAAVDQIKAEAEAPRREAV
jgi:K(+)-stimulated pyrophosphate-energized sodium pump